MISETISDYAGLPIYHGSTMEVPKPDLGKVRQGKDFGAGFYTTTNLEQAKQFANIAYSRYKGTASIVSEYRVLDFEGLRVKIFPETDPPTREWLQMILNCRKQRKPHSYDIVIGAIADDQTATVISTFLDGLYGDPSDYVAQDFAIRQFETQRLKDQIVFCTNRALARLSYTGNYQGGK